jgi:hypothetical protein
MRTWPCASVRKWSRRVACLSEDGVEPERDLILEDARSIREGMWRMAHLVQDATELLDLRSRTETWTAKQKSWRCERLSNAYRSSEP